MPVLISLFSHQAFTHVLMELLWQRTDDKSSSEQCWTQGVLFLEQDIVNECYSFRGWSSLLSMPPPSTETSLLSMPSKKKTEHIYVLAATALEPCVTKHGMFIEKVRLSCFSWKNVIFSHYFTMKNISRPSIKIPCILRSEWSLQTHTCYFLLCLLLTEKPEGEYFLFEDFEF